MYTAFFGLQAHPFETRTDARFYFAAPEYEEAIAAMQYEAQHGAGVGLILGQAGTGKTMAVRVLLSRLREKEKAIVVTASHDGGTDVLRELCKSFGVSLSASSPDARGLSRLRKALSRSVSQGACPVLIIDQAEHLSPPVLADIANLQEMEEGSGSLIRVILAAHVRFREILEQPAFARLRQLAFTRRLLTPLSLTEVSEYVQRRLSVAGATDPDIFSEEVLFLVAQRSGGIPRVINQICNAAMVAAFGCDESHVAARHMLDTPESTRPADPCMPELPTTLTTSEIVNELERASGPHDGDDACIDVIADSPAASQLSAMIYRAEQISRALQRRIPETTDVVDAAEQRIRQLLADTREKCLVLEARLAAETRRADQAMARLDQAKMGSARAQEIEARLTAFANQLAGQMDQVQSRVAEMMQYSVPLDDARGRLESTIRHADSVCGKIDESIQRGLERLARQCDVSHEAVERSTADMLESSHRKTRELLDGLGGDSAAIIAKIEGSVTTAMAECQRRAAEIVKGSEAQVEAAIRKVAQQIDDARETERGMQAATQKAIEAGAESRQAGEQTTHAAQSARQITDQAREIVEAVETVVGEGQRSAQAAREATDRIRSAERKASETSARLEADIATARLVAESFTDLNANADQKLEQFSSLHAVASSLHERLGRLLTAAHPVVDRADEALVRLEKQLSENESANKHLVEQAADVTSQATSSLDRAQEASRLATGQLKDIQWATQAAAHQTRELAALHDRTQETSVSLQAILEGAARWKSRMESFEAKLAAAEQTVGGLQDAVNSGLSLKDQFASLLERAGQERAVLEEAIGSLKHLLEVNSDAQTNARETAGRLDAFGQMMNSQVEAGQARLEQYHERMAEFEGQFEHFCARAADADNAGSKLQASIAEAHGQSENLERVCVAVRKVFAGLSQATLSAKEQAHEVEQFLAAANHTSASLRHWLERVRVQISGMIDDSPDAHLLKYPTHISALGMIAKEAQMLVEEEPGAVKAHMVDGGLEDAATALYSSPAGEISELIQRARTMQHAEAEWAGQAGD